MRTRWLLLAAALAWPSIGAAASHWPLQAVQAAAGRAATPSTVASPNALDAWRGLEQLDGAIALAELNDLAGRWVAEGYDEPDLVLQKLDELQKGLSAAPSLADMNCRKDTTANPSSMASAASSLGVHSRNALPAPGSGASTGRSRR